MRLTRMGGACCRSSCPHSGETRTQWPRSPPPLNRFHPVSCSPRPSVHLHSKLASPSRFFATRAEQPCRSSFSNVSSDILEALRCFKLALNLLLRPNASQPTPQDLPHNDQVVGFFAKRANGVETIVTDGSYLRDLISFRRRERLSVQ
jgi:hypothetical protein